MAYYLQFMKVNGALHQIRTDNVRLEGEGVTITLAMLKTRLISATFDYKSNAKLVAVRALFW